MIRYITTYIRMINNFNIFYTPSQNILLQKINTLFK